MTRKSGRENKDAAIDLTGQKLNEGAAANSTLPVRCPLG